MVNVNFDYVKKRLRELKELIQMNEKTNTLDGKKFEIDFQHENRNIELNLIDSDEIESIPEDGYDFEYDIPEQVIE